MDVFRSLERRHAFAKNRSATIDSIRLRVLCEWNRRVEKHLKRHPLRPSEMAGLSEKEKASLKQNPFRAYGSTLQAAMRLGSSFFFLSLGDGGCFLMKKKTLLAAFEEGEDEPVANVTHSLCEEDAYEHLKAAIYDSSYCDGAIVCTDGMINPYGSIDAFGKYAVLPTLSHLGEGTVKEVCDFVERLGGELGSGDDVSLGVIASGGKSRTVRKSLPDERREV